MRFDWLIVGAGFTGCVIAERIASQLNQRALVIERRDHVGGNAYDYRDEHGILVHRYGPHIFHTNDAAVWQYLSQFTSWLPYEHRVLACVEGKNVPVPFNLNALHALFPMSLADQLEALLLQEYGPGVNIPILKLKENRNPKIRKLSEYIYENLFYGYTLKQWGLTPEQLGPSVTGRVPVRISRDDRYFQDRYQGMPSEGYTAMFNRMLAHPNIEVRVARNCRQVQDEEKCRRVVYTGPIDSYFDYIHGALPYRSLRFEFEHRKVCEFQPVGTVNYPNGEAYTRITEFKRLTGQQADGTSIVIEYPQPFVAGANEPYYPIPQLQNAELYSKYQQEAEKMNGAVLFAGRLADYKYYNMDQAIARALMVFKKGVVSNGANVVFE
jgi:UDP-galactopyranose mutase